MEKTITSLLNFLFACTILSIVHAPSKTLASSNGVNARMRVIIDNDFSGDPDGLFQLAHHLLSPSVEICGIIGSRLSPNAGFDNTGNTSAKACAKARELIDKMGIPNKIPIVEGAQDELNDTLIPQLSEGARLIVEEALKPDTRPLYILCGAGLTNIASAWLMNHQIATKMTLVWIGGQEYNDFGNTPPGASQCEYNLNLDVKAAQVIFNNSNINIWQVPRNTYRQAICSMSELKIHLSNNPLGKYLFSHLRQLFADMSKWNVCMGEVYILGDSPLVLLTALQTGFEPDAASSEYVNMKTPHIDDNGLYIYVSHGRDIRVYGHIDTRLMLSDFFAKLELFSLIS